MSSLVEKIVKSVMEKGRTQVICDTCGLVLLNENTAYYFQHSRALNLGKPDKWIVLALEHRYYNPDHTIAHYQNGRRVNAPDYELQRQVDKTNPQEIEEFKERLKGLPF